MSHHHHHDPHAARVLFVLKRREDYKHHHSYSHQGVSTGLWNSASFVSDMLNKNNVISKVIQVIDNNDIDRVVTSFKPTHVIIEALWVVPEKFAVLVPLHPTVKWIIRLHSEVPFIANEGIAMKWIGGYLKYKNVSIAANSKRMLDETRFIIQEQYSLSDDEAEKKVFYLPNYYNPHMHGDVAAKEKHSRNIIKIGCFGAIRPLKNQLLQAIAALKFANEIGKRLEFHINIGRVEMKGDPILHNLIGLFENLEAEGHKLVTHQWMPHDKFVDLANQMDLGMQVSFSETFNIVAADLVSNGVPVVVSKEVEWSFPWFHADPTSLKEMVEQLRVAWHYPRLNVLANKTWLGRFSDKSEKIWREYFKPN